MKNKGNYVLEIPLEEFHFEKLLRSFFGNSIPGPLRIEDQYFFNTDGALKELLDYGTSLRLRKTTDKEAQTYTIELSETDNDRTTVVTQIISRETFDIISIRGEIPLGVISDKLAALGVDGRLKEVASIQRDRYVVIDKTWGPETSWIIIEKTIDNQNREYYSIKSVDADSRDALRLLHNKLIESGIPMEKRAEQTLERLLS